MGISLLRLEMRESKTLKGDKLDNPYRLEIGMYMYVVSS